MNKVTALLDVIATVITNVRTLADSLQAEEDVFAEFKPAEIVEQPVAQIPEKAAKPKKAKVYTLEDVRGVLAEKSQNGFTAEIKALIYEGFTEVFLPFLSLPIVFDYGYITSFFNFCHSSAYAP